MACKNYQTIVRLERLELCCIIGIYPHERQHVQPLSIDLELTIPQTQYNQIASTVDYATLASDLTNLALQGQFYLLEDLAEAFASHTLALALVQSVAITVRKPHAVPNAIASISIVRYQSH